MPRRNRTPKHQPYVDTASCQSKRRFKDEREAEAAIEIQALWHITLSSYKCERCGGWHLTRRKQSS